MCEAESSVDGVEEEERGRVFVCAGPGRSWAIALFIPEAAVSIFT